MSPSRTNIFAAIFRVIRTLLSAPFAIGAVILMGIAVWLLPKPERLRTKDATADEVTRG